MTRREPSGIAPPPRRSRRRRFSAAEHTFHLVALVWLLAAAALWGAAHALVRFAPVPAPDLESLRAPFVTWAKIYLAPEPQERRLYLVLTLLAPPVILAAWAVARRVTAARKAPGGSRDWIMSADWTVTGVALVVLAAATPIYLAWTAPIFVALFRPVIVGSLVPLMGGSLALWWGLGSGTGRRWGRVTKVWRGVTLAGALTLVLGAGFLARTFDYHTAALANPVHLNTALYPITQAVNGQHTLVDFVPQYGCYAEFLRPWFLLIGLSVFRVTATLAALQGLSMAALVLPLAWLLRSRWLLVMTAAALVWLMRTGFDFMAVPPSTPFALNSYDPYFQYFPVRVLFPAVSLLVVWWHLRQPSPPRAAAAGALGGAAVWWNLDTGAVTLVSILALLAAQALAGWRGSSLSNRGRGGRHLLAAAGAATAAMVVFYLVLSLNARQWVNLAAVLRYQQIFYISGFFMMPMPLTLHPWQLVAGIYLLGLILALKDTLTGRPLTVQPGVSLYLSVLGLGLFTYYQGRSHNDVLVLCCWPAVLLAALFGDRLLAATRYGLLPRAYAVGAFPVVLLGTACALCLWLSRESMAATETFRWQAKRHDPPLTHQPDAVAFIKGRVRAGESAGIISPYQAVYYAATGLCSGLTGPSIFECLLQEDVDRLMAQIRTRRVRHLFTEQTVYPSDYGHPLGPEFLATLRDFYHAAGRNPEGNLLEWQPRAEAGPGAFDREFAGRARLTATPPTTRHAVRCASPSVLLDQRGECVAFPYDWGTVPWGSNFAFEMVFTAAAQQSANACLFSNHPGLGFDGLTVQQGGVGNALYCAFGNGRAYRNSALFALTPGREQYLVVSCAAGTASLYLDGRLIEQFILDGPVPASVTTLTVGDWLGGNRHFQGDIAEVKIYEHALSAEAISANQRNLEADRTAASLPPSNPSPTPNP